MFKRYVLWSALIAALVLPAPVLASEEAADFPLAYNDNLGRQGELPVVKTGSSVYYPSGTYYFTETDLKVAARSIPMVWERTYRSNRVVKGDGRYIFAEPVDGPLGYGWTTPFTVRIEGDAFVNAEGRYLFFSKDANGVYLPNQEAGLVLKKTAQGYELSALGGNTHLFNQGGKLTAIRDTRGHTASLTYDAQGRLATIVDVMGREIFTFTYTAENRISRVTDLAGRSIDYGYDPFGNLEMAAHNGQVLARYSYNTYHGITSKANALDETYSIEYQFADKGIVKNVIDPVGTALIFQGKQPDGHMMSFQYDFLNRVYYVTDQLGVVRKFILNDAGNVVSSSEIIDGAETPKEKIEYLENRTTKNTDALGNVTLAQRDEWGNVIKKVDAEGFEWRYTYNSQGKLTSQTDPLGTVNRYEYDTFGNRTREIRAAGTEDESATGYVYSEYNELTSVARGEATTSYQYDNTGRITEIRDPLGNITSMAYDEAGNLLSRTQPLVGSTTYEGYDLQGNPAKATDSNGHIISFTYDSLGRVKTATSSADGGITRYEYGATSGGNCSSCGGSGGSGKLSALVLPEGNRIDYEYDAAGNLTKITDNDGNSIHYDYDSKGNRIREEIRDAAGALQKVLTYQHDLLSRLKKTVNPDGSATEVGYDPRGNRTSLKNPNGHTTRYEYDAAGRLIKVIQPGGIATGYTYDRRKNLTSVIDAGSNTTTYAYDKQDRLIKTVSPDTGTTTYTYDAGGNLKTKTDAKGVSATYSYDVANRLTQVSFPDPVDNLTYGYDTCANGKGRLCLMVDPSGTTTYEYTLKGQLAKEIKVIDGQTYVIAYGYDKNGNLTSLTYPSGRVVTYAYTNDRVTGILSNGAEVASNITYKPFGGIASLAYGNGIRHTVGYDQQYRIASIADAGIQNLAYSYDQNGNITAIVDLLDPTRSKTYGYDPLDRLTSATGSWGSLAYTYDGVGNRLKESNGGETTYRYQANRLLSVEGQKALTFDYDANGNTTSENVRTYIYNQNQRLIKVNEDGTTKGEYVYNGKGQRVKKSANGQYTIFFFNQQANLIAEIGATSADYLWLTSNPFAKVEGIEVYYYHNDHLGTPQRVTDITKQIVWAVDFMPFGEVLSIAGTIVNNLRFPGQYNDGETSISYNYYRDYVSKIGKYIEADPVGIKDENHLYIYAQNKPVTTIDQLGLLSSTPAGTTTCDFYDDMCEKSKKCGPYDRYACITKKCCEAFGNGPVPDCIRGCLYKWETYKCSAYSGDAKKKCRRIEHWDCYTRCNGDILGAYYLLFPKKECIDSMNEVGGMLPW